jgi:leucyl aminopeptidase
MVNIEFGTNTSKSLDCNLVIIISQKNQLGVFKDIVKDLSGFDTLPSKVLKAGESLSYRSEGLDKEVIWITTDDQATNLVKKVRTALKGYQNKDTKVAVVLDEVSEVHQLNALIGFYLGDYDFASQKSSLKLTNFDVIVFSSLIAIDSINEIAQKTALAQKFTMSLLDLPPNIKNPNYIVEKLKGFDLPYTTLTILDEKSLKEQGCDAVLAVGQGSEYSSFMTILNYNGNNDKSEIDLALIGKGVTFDTGGISIKSSTNMHYMKSDLGGAAAVLGAIHLIANLGLKINVVAITPLVENAIDAGSIRPGDVINSYAGKTIEIIDTDAEGRLILADALSYAIKNFNPQTIVDAATLTGSCVATLGYAAGGMFSHSDDLCGELTKAGEATSEKLWRLPLWKEYEDHMYSDVADIKNYSGKPIAGAISAAKFLEFFVEDHPRWAHLDIAGVAFGDTDLVKSKVASGYGVRLLTEFAKNLILKN